MQISVGVFSMSGRFLNEGAIALFADGIKVEGSVHLSENFLAKGEVRLVGATIDSVLTCCKGRFINPNGLALSADRVKVSDNVFLNDGFTATGTVCLSGAAIGRYFVWAGVLSPTAATLDLRSARIGILRDDEESWPDRGKLFIDGLIYDEIADDAPSDVQSREDWLRRQPADQFRPQPYEQLAVVLRKSGRDEHAKQILISKNEDPAKLSQMTFWEKAWHHILGWTIGYGYRPLWTLRYMLGFVVLGSVLFGVGFETHLITPTKQVAYTRNGASRNDQSLGDHLKFNAVVYSIDQFVPLVNLQEASYWLPNGNRGNKLLDLKWFKLRTGGLLCGYMYIHIFFGWLLTTLLVVGLTGLLRG